MALRTIESSRQSLRALGTNLKFSGTAGILTLGTTNPFTGSFYFSTWIKWGGVNGNYQTIFAKRDSYAAAGLMFSMSLHTSTGALSVDTVNSYINFNYLLPQGKWVHMTWVHNTAGSSDILYIDGVAVSTLALGTLGSKTDALISIGACQSPAVDFFNGNMEEVVIGTGVPTATEVYALAKKGVRPATVWTYLTANEGSGTAIADSSGNSNNGTISTGITFDSNPPPHGITRPDVVNGLRFNGSTSYLALGTMGGFGSSLLSGFYTKFKVKTTTTALSAVLGVLNSGGTKTAFTVALNSDYISANVNQRLRVFIRDENNNSINGNTTNAFNFNDGAFHTFEITVNVAGSSVVILIDGVSQAFSTAHIGTMGTFANLNTGLMVGARNNAGTVQQFLNGTISDLSIGTTSSTLFGRYLFGENTGTTTTDASGQSNTGTLSTSSSGLPLWNGRPPTPTRSLV